MLFLKPNRRSVIERELREIARREMKLATAAYRTKESPWKEKLEQLIPENVHAGLEKAFAAGFSLLIEQGSSLLEKSFDRESIRREFERRDAAVQTRGTRRELRELYRSGRQTGNAGTAFAAVEGTALGAVGIGMPDIVFFLAVLLRGI
ncbi:MAG: EcsC family protein, partial [Ruminococcaceae bacterium]|nr:EcsC family protein [Oscillospiraceae bacterium]